MEGYLIVGTFDLVPGGGVDFRPPWYTSRNTEELWDVSGLSLRVQGADALLVLCLCLTVLGMGVECLVLRVGIWVWGLGLWIGLECS